MKPSTIALVLSMPLFTVTLIHYGPHYLDRAIRALTHAVFGVGLLLWSGKEGEGL